MYKLVKKTQMLKKLAKKWNKTTFGNIFAQLQTLEDELSKIQEELITNYDQRKAQKQSRILQKKTKLLHFQKTYWNERAKTKHLNLSDTNSRYFHKVGNGRRNKKFIKEIKTNEGTVISGEENIKKEVRSNFKKRFPNEHINRPMLENCLRMINTKILESENEDLTRPVTNEEVKSAIFNIEKDKSLGPDDFTVGFFQKY